MKNAMLFPGQGSQVPDMLVNLPRHPSVLSLFAQMKTILGLEPGDLDSTRGLQSTKNAQIALFVAGVASFHLVETFDIAIDFVAGLSIGTFAAAVACGAASFEDLLPVVALRGRLMEEAYPEGYGMTAILGLSFAKVSQIVAQVHRVSGPVFVANHYGPKQTVLAGSTSSLRIAAEEALRTGAVSAKLLDVSCPSHCSLLQKVQIELTAALSTIHLRDARCPYVSNLTTRLVQNGESIRTDLQSNVANALAWTDAMQLLRELDVRNYIEAFPGDVLSNIEANEDYEVRRIPMQSGWKTALSRISLSK